MLMCSTAMQNAGKHAVNLTKLSPVSLRYRSPTHFPPTIREGLHLRVATFHEDPSLARNDVRYNHFLSRAFSSSWAGSRFDRDERPVWSDEWKRIGLGAQLVDSPAFPSNLFFVQLGFGVDQHGDRSDATKASVRAIRNAIEFNSIPGVIEHIPGGRKGMMIHVKLGVPSGAKVDVFEVAKVFPYGKLLPIKLTTGGLHFATGRVVEELGDSDDIGICVCACVSIGYEGEERKNFDRTAEVGRRHKTFNTKDGH